MPVFVMLSLGFKPMFLARVILNIAL